LITHVSRLRQSDCWAWRSGSASRHRLISRRARPGCGAQRATVRRARDVGCRWHGSPGAARSRDRWCSLRIGLAAGTGAWADRLTSVSFCDGGDCASPRESKNWCMGFWQHTAMRPASRPLRRRGDHGRMNWCKGSSRAPRQPEASKEFGTTDADGWTGPAAVEWLRRFDCRLPAVNAPAGLRPIRAHL
jgi:hypothetical protein